MTDTHIKRYNGIAGGGKTYNIVREVEDALDNGVAPDRIAVTTFSKEQAIDLHETFTADFDGDVYDSGHHDDEGITISTSHSMALKRCRQAGMVDLQENRIISMDNYTDTEVFEEFFRDYSSSYFDYQYVSNDGDEDFRMELPAGNKVIQAYNYVRSRGIPYEQYDEAPVNVPVRRSVVIQTMNEWDSYKDAWYDRESGDKGLLQHTDYLYEAYENDLDLNYDVLIWDEFQDVNKIQYGLYEMWRDNSDLEKIVLAGDSNQQIFGFRGASSRYLEKTPVQEEELIHTSRRCKPNVLEKAREILDPVDGVDTSDFRAVKPDGSEYGDDEQGTAMTHKLTTPDKLADLVTSAVNKYTVENDEWDGSDDETDGVYVLARSHSQLKKAERTLEKRGIPFGGMGSRESRWDDDLMPILGALRAFERRDSVPPVVLEYLLRNATAGGNREPCVKEAREGKFGTHVQAGFGYDEEDWLTSNGEIPAEKVSWLFDGASDAKTIIRRLDLSERVTETLTNALTTDPRWLPDSIGASTEPVIKTGTIHSSKGKQAEAVVLLSAYSTTQLDRYRNGDEDEERRLYYTAATRARTGLHITQNFTGDETFPPLDQ